MEENITDPGTDNGELPNLENVIGSQQLNASNLPINTDINEQSNKDDKKDDNNTSEPVHNPFEVNNKEDKTEKEINTVVNLLKENDDKLEESNKNIKQETLAIFKGKSIDQNNNIINEKGETAFTFDQLKEYIKTGKLPLDDKGNEVNNLGEIIKTVEDLNKENSVVLAAQTKLKEELGLSLLDDKGNELQYEDTTEGVVKLVEDALQVKSINTIQDFLIGNPVLNDVFKHLALGGDIKDYQSTNIDYKNIELKSLNKSNKLEFIKNSLIKQGLKSPENMLALIEQAGDDKIDKEAANALLMLDSLQKEEINKRTREFELKQEQQKEENIRYWSTVKNLVDKGELENLTIPKNERDAFFNYLSQPVDNKGRSKDHIAEDNESAEFKLMISYLRYKDYNINKLASLISKEQNIKTLRERLKNAGNKVKSASTHNTGTDDGEGVSIPSLEKLLGR